MEIFTIIVSGLLSLITPVGLIVDRTAENTLKKQFSQVEELKVRVDNAPTHQLIQGKVNKVRIAGRGIQLKGQDIRIAALELETDILTFDVKSLTSNSPQLLQPLQAGLRIVLDEADVNKLLQSPEFLSLLEKLNIVNIGWENNEQESVFGLTNPQVNFLANNRLNFQIELRNHETKESVKVELETGIRAIAGRQLQPIDPIGNVEGEIIPTQLLNQIVENINQRFDLRQLEGDGFQARILRLDVKPSQIEIAAFIRILPSSNFLPGTNSGENQS